jgi:hypothetical protein
LILESDFLSRVERPQVGSERVVQEGERDMERMVQHTRRWMVGSVLLLGVLSVTEVSTALEIGEFAPDFTLPSTTGEAISLSQFRGQKLVLLEFYVNDFGAT